MSSAMTAEVDANYDFFCRNLKQFLAEHDGQYALLKNRAVVEFFPGPGEAYRFGQSAFPDGIFSIQEVNDEPIDLGFFSHVAN